MKYRMIAIDLDGTLLCPEGRVSRKNRAAMGAAADAGVVVVPCTGRGWRESHQVLGAMVGELGVFNSGGLVHRLEDGETVDRAVFEAGLAKAVIESWQNLPEAVLVFTDPAETGLEYILTGEGEPSKNSLWWFESNGLRHQRHRTPGPEHLSHVVRIGTVVSAQRAEEIERQVLEDFAGRVEVHNFAAVQMPDPAESMHIVEVFPKAVSKWRGIEFVAGEHGIALDEVAVIGDQINDLPMFERAACAVAMGNAIDSIKAAAHQHTLCNREHGVAHAIEQMLSGQW